MSDNEKQSSEQAGEQKDLPGLPGSPEAEAGPSETDPEVPSAKTAAGPEDSPRVD